MIVVVGVSGWLNQSRMRGEELGEEGLWKGGYHKRRGEKGGGRESVHIPQ